MSAVHTFLPWARRGLASKISDNEIYDGSSPMPSGYGTTMVRGKIDAFVHINNGNAFNVPLQIVGPGDVIGIHQDVVIKTEPHPWITNFEPHSFPYIDFYEEDFPWRYTPAKPVYNSTSPTGKLRPWLTLIVLKENEFEKTTVPNGPLPALKLDSSFYTNSADRPLPNVDELWAWAHVSVEAELNGTLADALNSAVNANPNVAFSRIICPRKLEQNTSYHAFLIPTYETGRLAGLGKTVGAIPAQKTAWDHTTSWSNLQDPNEPWLFPIYYEWYFRTGVTGDFEYLVRQIQPRVADLKVGRRMMDISSPGYGIFFTAGTPGVDQGTETLEGALKIPNFTSPVFADFTNQAPTYPLSPPRTAENQLRDKLKDFVNLGEDMLFVPGSNTYYSSNNANNLPFPDATDQPIISDPIIAPPIYGRWHALRSRVDPNDGSLYWLNELNLDPRYRLAAGLGAEYVRKRQDYLMQKAWEQVGPILEANTSARLAQLAQATADALHQRHINNQPIAHLLSITNSVHGKIKTGAITLKKAAIDSNLPNSAPSSTFRKIAGPNSPLSKRTNQQSVPQAAVNVMENMRVNNVRPVEAKAEPGNNNGSVPVVTVTGAVAAIQSVTNTNLNFNITVPGGGSIPASPTVVSNFKTAIAPYANVLDVANWPGDNFGSNLNPSISTITDSIDPRVTHTRSFYNSVYLSTQPPVSDVIVPIMTAPSFHMPMYEALLELGKDFLIPNLHLLPQNSVTIFESNQKFIESFMVGANYEMGRELLWREYPTDQRGTYFNHFWGGLDSGDSESATRDIQPIHLWNSMSPLGSHNGRAGTKGNPTVLAIRGDLLKKFPNAAIYLLEAEWDKSPNHPIPNYWERPRRLKANGSQLFPTFSAKVNPDITFLGFNADKDDLRGDKVANATDAQAGYFLIFQERPGELRFGLDHPTANTPIDLSRWSDLSWNHVVTNNSSYLSLSQIPNFDALAPATAKQFPPNPVDVEWAEDSAAMAMILYQNPVMVAIHSYEMIP